MAKLRGTKLRALTRSGDKPKVLPSRSRPHKPPAKAISARKAAGMQRGGGKIPPKVRRRLENEPMPRRAHPVDQREQEQTQSTRYGKRAPKARRHDEAAEVRDARPSRRANVPAPDPGTRRDRKARPATER